MIAGLLEDLPSYITQPIAEHILSFVKQGNHQPGKYTLPLGLFAIVISCSSRSLQGQEFEAHRKYLDIHCLLSSREIIAFTPAEKLPVAVPYDAEKDVILYNAPSQYSFIDARQGSCILFFPDDAHCAQGHHGESIPVIKIVFKVPLAILS